MTHFLNDSKKAEVWSFIQEMNATWTKEKMPEKLNNYFHEKMVVVNPVQNERLEGKKACVDAWTAFVNSVENIFWQEREPFIELYGDDCFAIVSYYFDMTYEVVNTVVEMKGRDLFALVKENGKWLVVSDEYSINPI